MPPAPQPPDEAARLTALLAYEILDTEPEPAFEELVALAAKMCCSPMAAITFVDQHRQWFKASVGLGVTETPREVAFCAHAILDANSPLVVPDAMADARFEDNPSVTGPPHIRSYLGVPLKSRDGHALGTLCVIDDKPRAFGAEVDMVNTLARAVTANIEVRHNARQQSLAAQADPITGLLNRNAAVETLRGLVKNGGKVAVIAVDLDHFKEINDAAGHAAGDHVLRTAAMRLRECVRDGDIVARLGGDEFLVFLKGIDDPEVSSEVALRIVKRLAAPIRFKRKSFRLGGTCGITHAPRDSTDSDLLLRAADEALSRTKRIARGTVGMATADDADGLLRAKVVIAAVDHEDNLGGAFPTFQPVVNSENKIATFEVLARWNNPKLGSVPPDVLLSMIGPDRFARISDLVRRKSLEMFGDVQAMFPDVRLSLNLSACEVYQTDIAQRISEQIASAGLSLTQIKIEITEEVLIERVSDKTLDQLASLRGRGAKLFLDDFGTGTSGLAQLLRLPLDGIKIDKQFVMKLPNHRGARQIVEASIALAHSMGLLTIAEGVEAEQQATLLRELGCDQFQGYFYGKPMAIEELIIWYSQRSVVVPMRSHSTSEE